MAMMYLKPMGFWAFALLKGLTSVVVLKVERWQILSSSKYYCKKYFLYQDHYNPSGAVLLKEWETQGYSIRVEKHDVAS